jgi:hypothetical protein
LSLRGLRVVVREEALKLRACVLIYDGLRDDLSEAAFAARRAAAETTGTASV